MTFTDDGPKGVSPFTDEHLKRLKEYAQFENRTPIDMLALIARLEAAERCLERHRWCPEWLVESGVVHEWRKAAGK